MTQTERAVYSIHINASREAVWRELTKFDQPQDALWHGVLHVRSLEPGNRYQMRSSNGRVVTAVGEVLACDPPRLLQQTMRFTQYDDPACTITFELVDAPQGGVDVTLTVEQLVAGTKTAKTWQGGGGGDWVCKTLKEVVEDGRPSLATRAMYRVFDVVAPLGLPRRSRSEHWPLDA